MNAPLFLSVVVAVLLTLLPLPFGGVLPWARAAFAAISLACGMAAVLTWKRLPPPIVLVTAVSVLLLAALGWFQSRPWPVGVINDIAPRLVELQARAAEVAGAPLPARVPLSLAPDASLAMSVELTALVALLLATARAVEDRRGRRVLALGVCSAAILEIALGAGRFGVASTPIWGLWPSSADRLQGTFVNPDHLAFLLEGALAVAFAWGWKAILEAWYSLHRERHLFRVAAPALVWLVLLAALTLTGSRAGLTAAVVATVFQGVTASAVHRHWRWMLGVGLALVLGVAFVLGPLTHRGLGRWLRTSRADVLLSDRLDVHDAALRVWRQFPLTGTGLGTFEEAFPLASLTSDRYAHAHNDYLELLATGGAVGAALAAVAAVTLLLGAARATVRGPLGGTTSAAGLAAVGAAVALGIHSWFDFGLVLPANAAVFTVILGAAAALAPPEAPRRRTPREGTTRTGGSTPSRTAPPARDSG